MNQNWIFLMNNEGGRDYISNVKSFNIQFRKRVWRKALLYIKRYDIDAWLKDLILYWDKYLSDIFNTKNNKKISNIFFQEHRSVNDVSIILWHIKFIDVDSYLYLLLLNLKFTEKFSLFSYRNSFIYTYIHISLVLILDAPPP